MQTPSPRDQFLDTLYSAAVGATPWKLALESFASLVDAPMGSVNVYSQDHLIKSHVDTLNIPESFQKRSQEHWLAQEPWVRKGYEMVARDPLSSRMGFVFHGAAQVPTGALMESAWYRDFGREAFMQDNLALSTVAGEGIVVSMSASTGGPGVRLFTPAAVKQAEGLLADFRRAVSLHLRLARKQNTSNVAAQWANSKLPVLVLSNGEILHANTAGAQVLELGDIAGILPGHRIHFHDSALADLARSHERAEISRQATVIATAQSGARWMAQFVKLNQLAGSLIEMIGSTDPAVLVILTPLDTSAAGRTMALDSLAVLTGTEREIAHQILCGDTVASMARHRRQSAETIRWHIRNMIEKTGARNLADLHRILALLLPL